jgi:hypothetical protein
MNQNLFSQLKQSLQELVSGRQTPSPVTRTVVVKVEKTVHQEPSSLQNPPSPQSLSSEPEPKSPQVSEQPQNEELIVLPSDNPFALKQFTELHTDLVFKYLLKRIRMAVREDMPSVNLFQFGNTRKLAQIARPEYETQLNSLMDYFVKKEDYELAARCRDTLTRHKQNEGRRPS